jgi:hypothetical protein
MHVVVKVAADGQFYTIKLINSAQSAVLQSWSQCQAPVR